MKKVICLILTLFITTIFTSCNFSNIDMVKDKVFDELDPSLSLGEVLETYKYFTKTEWEERESERGRKLVQFVGYYSYNEKNHIVKMIFIINETEYDFVLGGEFYKPLNRQGVDYFIPNMSDRADFSFLYNIYKNQPLFNIELMEKVLYDTK
ncbi:MAG: hypothetical protein KGV59_04875 [Tenacibaculum sp.]|nr:hypothetical protein [Tenacibaculum sp.]